MQSSLEKRLSRRSEANGSAGTERSQEAALGEAAAADDGVEAAEAEERESDEVLEPADDYYAGAGGDPAQFVSSANLVVLHSVTTVVEQ